MVTERVAVRGYPYGMVDDWGIEAIRQSGLKQAEIARRLGGLLGKPIDRSIVNKISLGKRGVKGAEMVALSKVTRYPIPGMTLVPVVAMVSAGDFLDPQMPISVDDPEVEIIQELKGGDLFATEVVGDSMDRISPPGSRIIVDRADRELVDGKAYIFATRDGATYKTWRAKPPRLEPASNNPRHTALFLSETDEAKVIGRVVRTSLSL